MGRASKSGIARRRRHQKSGPLLAAAGALTTLTGAGSASAATYYWDTTTTGSIATGTNWSTSPTGSPAGTVAPGSGDVGQFNGTAVNGAETVTVPTGTNYAIGGLAFTNTGTTLIDSSSTTAGNLSIGASGITIASGAGLVTTGNSTNPTNILLANTQTWTQSNNTAGFNVVSGISGTSVALTINGTGNGTTSLLGVISGNMSLTLGEAGTGTADNVDFGNGVTTSNTYSGGTTILAGGVFTRGGTTFGTGGLTLGNASGGSASVQLNGRSGTTANAITLASGSTGTYAIITAGSSSPIFSGGITGTHNLTLSAYQGAGTGGGTLTVSTGSLNNSGIDTFTGYTGTGGPVAGVINVSAVIGTNVAGIVINGSSTEVVTFSGANLYTCPTTITSGTLRASSSSSALGAGSAVSIANSAAAQLNLSTGVTIGSLAGGGTTGGNVNLGSSNLTIMGNSAAPVTYGGVIGGTGSVVVGSGTNTGTQILAGSNTYSGSTTVNAGTLTATNTQALGTGAGTVNLGTTGSTLSLLNDGGTGTVTGQTITYGGSASTAGYNVVATAGIDTINVGNNGNAGSTGNTIQLGTFSSNKQTVFTNANGYNLALGSATSSSTVAFTNNMSGGTLTLNSFTDSSGSGGVLTFNGSSATATTVVTNVIAPGTGTLTVRQSGLGTLILTGQNTYNSLTNVSSGTLIGSTAQAFGLGNLLINPTTSPATVSASNSAFSQTAVVTVNSGPGAAVGTLYLNDVGPVIESLNGSNGVVSLNGSSGGTQIITLTLGQSGSNSNFSGTINDAGTGKGSLFLPGTGTINLTGSNSYGGGTTLYAGTLNGSTGSFGSGNLLINPQTTAVTVNSNGSIAPTALVVVNSDVNNAAGATGTLIFNDVAPVVGDLEGNGAVVLNNAAGTTLSVGQGAPTQGNAFTGTISDANGVGSLTKVGSGVINLGGSNTYRGATTVSQGTLAFDTNGTAVNNPVPNSFKIVVSANATLSVGNASNFAVAAGQVLAGSGTVTGPVTLPAGSTVSGGTGATAGDLPGTLTFGDSQVTASGGTYAVKLDLANASHANYGTGGSAPTGGSPVSDELLLVSGLSTGASLSITPVPRSQTDATGSTYSFLIAAAPSVPGEFTGLINTTDGSGLVLAPAAGDPNSYHLSESNDGTELFLDVTAATPEPTSLLLAGLAAAPLTLGRRRRMMRT